MNDIVFQRSKRLSPRTIVYDHYCAEGSAGEVLRGHYGRQPVAIKVYRAPTEQFFAETAILLSVRHPNVVRLLGAFIVYDQCIAVSEFAANGDLYTFLRTGGNRLNDATCIRLATDIASGLRALHRVGVIHGDMKSSNVLVDEWWRAKVCDFSLSMILEHGVDAVTSARPVHGTPLWLAPEVFATRTLSAASDVYSLGILLWELATSCTPFDELPGDDIESVRHAVVTVQQRPHYRPTNATQRRLYALMQCCWRHEASARPTATQVGAEAPLGAEAPPRTPARVSQY